jgi:hypothetical protein
MYFSKLLMHNDGPIEHIEVEFPIEDGVPHPVIIVGENGVGKTNLLSVLADAIIESAAQGHNDIVNNSSNGRSWFRYVGGNIKRRGASGYLNVVQFIDADEDIRYSVKSGDVNYLSLDELPPDDRYEKINIDEIPADKNISISRELSTKIHESGVYGFSPTTRNEIPHWFNAKSIDNLNPYVFSKIHGNLGRKIIWEQMLPRVSQWVTEIILDSRIDVSIQDDDSTMLNERSFKYQSGFIKRALRYRLAINQILQIILDDKEMQIFWRDRLISDLIISNEEKEFPLSSLSTGQSTLFSLFGTIIMYADQCYINNPFEVSGSVVIDEIDSHLHIDLVNRALPELIKLFPAVQFILSSHSPFFIAGMRDTFGAKGIKILKLPEGEWIDAEDFSEFGRALNVFRELTSFKKEVEREVLNVTKPTVYCEGPTDVQHIKAAGEALEYSRVLESIDIRAVGDVRRSKGGGASNLETLYNTVIANTTLARGKVFVVFDNDTKNKCFLDGRIRSYTFPQNEKNKVITEGIENIYPEEAFCDDFFYEEEFKPKGGRKGVVEKIDKMKFLKYIQDNSESIPGYFFDNFKGLFEEIKKWLED